jgi:hypothetical protein
VAEGAEPQFDPAHAAYLLASPDSTSLRLPKLTRGTFTRGDPASVDLRCAATPFHVHLSDLFSLGAVIDGQIDDLPSSFFASLSETSGKVSYRASKSLVLSKPHSRIRQVVVDANSPVPLAGRATHINVLAEDLPASLDVQIAPAESPQPGLISLDGVGYQRLTEDPVGGHLGSGRPPGHLGRHHRGRHD